MNGSGDISPENGPWGRVAVTRFQTSMQALGDVPVRPAVPDDLARPSVGRFVVHGVPLHWSRVRWPADAIMRMGYRIPPMVPHGERHWQSRRIYGEFRNFVGDDPDRVYARLFGLGGTLGLESVLTGVADRDDGGQLRLHAAVCERGLLALIPPYLEFCRAIWLESPILILAAFVGCAGARAIDPFRPGTLAEYRVEESVAMLPEYWLHATEPNGPDRLRPLCDSLWQTVGIERSPHFD